jgi:AcrR family transcriptional regulator
MSKPARAPRQTQAARRDEAERRLVEATMAVIAEEGVSAATFEAIGQRAGYSRGLASQHFGSKQGLIDAVVDYLHERQDEDLEAAHINAMNGLDGLLAYVRRFCASLKRSREPKSYFMLLSDAVADAQETRTVFAQSHAKVKTRLAKLIRRGQAEGLIRRDIEPDSAALMVGSLLLGLSIQSLTDPAMRIDPVEKAITTLLTRSFAPPGGKAGHA